MIRMVLLVLLSFVSLLNMAGCGNLTTGRVDAKDIPTIKESVLYSSYGVRITALDLKYDDVFSNFFINTRIQNTSDKDINVIAGKGVVNGIYMGTMGLFLNADVKAGETIQKKLIIDEKVLNYANLEKIGNIKFEFITKIGGEEKKPELVEIKTSEDWKNEFKPNTKGLEVFNNDGIRIVGQGVESGDFGSLYRMCIENTTDKDISVSLVEFTDGSFNNIILNGEETNLYFDEEIPAQTVSYPVMNFMNTNISGEITDNEDKIEVESLIFSLKIKSTDPEGNINYETEQVEFIN